MIRIKLPHDQSCWDYLQHTAFGCFLVLAAVALAHVAHSALQHGLKHTRGHMHAQVNTRNARIMVQTCACVSKRVRPFKHFHRAPQFRCEPAFMINERILTSLGYAPNTKHRIPCTETCQLMAMLLFPWKSAVVPSINSINIAACSEQCQRKIQ